MNTTGLRHVVGWSLLGLILGPAAAMAAEAAPATQETKTAVGTKSKAPLAPTTSKSLGGHVSVKEAPALGKQLGPQAGRLTEIEQARGLKDLKDMPRDAAHMPERNGSLTDPAGAGLGQRDDGRFPSPSDLSAKDAGSAGFKNPMGQYMPDLPSNRDKTRSFGVEPSTNPRDWMSGSRSSGRTWRVNHGGHTEVHSENRDSNGNVTSHQVVSYYRDGTFMNSQRTVYGRDGSSTTTFLTRTNTTVDMRTGATTVQVEESREHWDANGNVTRTGVTTRELGGQKHDPSPTVAGGGGINKTMDPNADGGDGSVCRAMPWTCRGAPAKNPTQVNPGKEPGGFAPTPKINPGDSIVVNPATESVRQANQARQIDPAGARRAVDSGTQINPPGPND